MNSPLARLVHEWKLLNSPLTRLVHTYASLWLATEFCLAKLAEVCVNKVAEHLGFTAEKLAERLK